MNITTRVADFCANAEDITEELTHTAGSVTTKAAPLMATLASGLSVFYAIYDGLGKLIEASGGNHAYVISGCVAAIATAGLEGASLGSVFNQDRAKAINATREADQQVSEGSLPGWTLFLSASLVVALEIIPAYVRWLNGAVTAADLAFAAGLLTLPFLGRIGALIYSQSQQLDEIDGAGERRAKRKEQRLQSELDLEIRREEARQRLAQQAAEHAQKLQIERAKAEKKIGSIDGHSEGQNGQIAGTNRGNVPENVPAIEDLNAARSNKQKARLDRTLSLIESGEFSLKGIADSNGVSEKTADRDIKTLRDMGYGIVVNGVVKFA